MVLFHPLFRRRLKIRQRIVHPPHVPLVIKPKTALPGRLCNIRPGRGVLRNQKTGRVALFQPLVHILQKYDGSPVLPPGRVALPVNHVADGVHPQAVKMKLCQPVIGRRLEKAPHLSPGMHEIAASPLTPSHILVRVLIQGRTVIIPQRIIIHRKMNWHKIHDNPDIMAVEKLYHMFQLLRRAVSGSRAEKPCYLISPGLIAGMLRKGQNFHIIVPLLL